MTKRICTVENCGGIHLARGLCRPHYKQWWDRNREGDECSVEECTRIADAQGMCGMHYQRWIKYGDPNFVTRSWGNGKTAEVVGYPGAHRRVTRRKGSASQYQCEHCPDQAIDWSYNHEDPNEMAGIHGSDYPNLVVRYSLSPDFYIPLCRPCHRKLDAQRERLSEELVNRVLRSAKPLPALAVNDDSTCKRKAQR